MNTSGVRRQWFLLMYNFFAVRGRVLAALTAVLLLCIAFISCTGSRSDTPRGTPVETANGAEETAPVPTDEPTAGPTEEPTEEPAPQKPAAGVELSHPGGFYAAGFDLSMTAAEGYEIYYTTDGTKPTTGSKHYVGPVSLTDSQNRTPGRFTKELMSLMGYPIPASHMPKGRVIRAVAVSPEGEYTAEAFETYMIWPAGAALYDAPVVSLFVDKGGFDGKTGIYFTTMQHPFDTKPRAVAYCQIFDEAGKERAGQWIEISLSGNGSLGNLQKSIRLYFKSDANPDITDNPGKLRYDIFRGEAKDSNGKVIRTYKRLMMRNAGNDAVGSFMSDRVSQKLSAMLGYVDYQEARSVIVLINGELWGTYNMRERFGAKYFEAHYGVLEENFAMLEAPTPLKTGNGNSPYELTDGTEQDLKDWEALVKLITRKDMSKAENYSQVTAQLDVDSLISVMIAHMYLCNGDFPWNNVKVWRCNSDKDPSRLDTRWRFVVMDMDGGLISDYNSNMFAHALNNNTILGAVTVSLLKNEGFKQKFIDRCIYAAEVVYTKERCLEVINSTAAEVKKPIQANFLRWKEAGASLGTWQSKVDYMKQFAARRGDVWLEQMYSYFGITRTAAVAAFDANTVLVRLNGKAAKSGDKIMLGTYTDAGGKTVKYEITPKDGYRFDCLIVTDVRGKQQIVTAPAGEVEVSGESTLTVCMIKDGASVKTEPCISAGGSELFAVTADGVLYAWGGNSAGAMGIAPGTYSRPVKLLTGVHSVYTAQGGSTGDAPFTYVITADGRVLTAGNNAYGQLGRTGNGNAFAPIKLPAGGAVKEISLGFDHALMVMEDGTLWGIGNNAFSQLGSIGADRSSKWVKIADKVVSAAAGRRHTLYVTSDGSLYALGDNRWRKLSSTGPEVLATPLKLASNAKAAFAGEHSALYIDNDNVLYYIGTRANMISGGITGKANRLFSNVQSVSMQEGHALILTVDGNLYGWGENGYGQVDPARSGNQGTPVLIIKGCAAAGAGAGYSVYIDGSGKVTAWGANSSGIAGKGALSEKVKKSEITLS